MRRRVFGFKMRFCVISPSPGLRSADRCRRRAAQSGDARAQDQSGKAGQRQSGHAADAAKDNQRKTDEFVEAAQAINGPAGNPECVWLGRRVVRLMWRDDLDTAFRHLDLYDRFGCPGGHVQATFRCLTRFGGQIDPKVAGYPEQPRSRLLDQSGRATADRSRGASRPRPRPRAAPARQPRLPPRAPPPRPPRRRAGK